MALILFPFPAFSQSCLPADEAKVSFDGEIYSFCDGAQMREVCDPNLIDSGLVGHWRLDEVEGTVAYDASGNGNHGNWNGSADVNSAGGRVDIAHDFDGFDDYFNIPRNASMEPSNAITVAAWVYWDDPANSYHAKVLSKEVAGNSSFAISQDASTSRMRFETNSGSYRPSPDVSVPTGQWAHVAGSWSSGNTVKIYVNGVLAGQSASSYTGNLNYDNARDFRIGHNSNGQTENQFDGRIDDVRIYNRELEVHEINHLASLTALPYIGLPTPVAHWTMNETSGAILADASGNANNGNMEGGLNGSSDTISGPRQTGLVFDGDNYVSFTDHSDFHLTTFTLSAWINPDNAVTSNYGLPIFEHRDGGNVNYEYAIDGSGNVSGFDGTMTVAYSNGSFYNLRGTQAISSGSWQHIAFTYDGSTGAFTHYHNGVAAGSGTASPPIITNPSNTLSIGRSDDQGNNPLEFDGGLDDMRIYDEALSPAQIMLLYSIGNEFKCAQTDTCSNAGVIDYITDQGAFAYCDGVRINKIGRYDGGIACSNAGEQDYNTGTNRYQYCDGQNIINIP